jgi:hypothetical protein
MQKLHPNCRKIGSQFNHHHKAQQLPVVIPITFAIAIIIISLSVNVFNIPTNYSEDLSCIYSVELTCKLAGQGEIPNQIPRTQKNTFSVSVFCYILPRRNSL